MVIVLKITIKYVKNSTNKIIIKLDENGETH
jgi:hypothetical protein